MNSTLHNELDAREAALDTRIQAARHMHKMLALRVESVEKTVQSVVQRPSSPQTVTCVDTPMRTRSPTRRNNSTLTLGPFTAQATPTSQEQGETLTSPTRMTSSQAQFRKLLGQSTAGTRHNGITGTLGHQPFQTVPKTPETD